MSKVAIVMVMEVLVTDSVDVICVTEVFDVDLALDDQFLNLILISFFPRLYRGEGGGHQPWPGGRFMAMC